MADLEDLETKSITDMTPDEAIEYLRQIRLSRRTPEKKTKSASANAKSKQSAAAAKITSQDAKSLLKFLGA